MRSFPPANATITDQPRGTLRKRHKNKDQQRQPSKNNDTTEVSQPAFSSSVTRSTPIVHVYDTTECRCKTIFLSRVASTFPRSYRIHFIAEVYESIVSARN